MNSIMMKAWHNTGNAEDKLINALGFYYRWLNTEVKSSRVVNATESRKPETKVGSSSTTWVTQSAHK